VVCVPPAAPEPAPPTFPTGFAARCYRAAFTSVATRIDAERAHLLAAGAIRLVGALPPVRATVSWALARGRGPVRPAPFFARTSPGLLGVAAGFDKDARMAAGLAALGFAFIEIGTVTARDQPGTDRPRLWRVPARRALVNRMGFNNAGALAAARRLRTLRRTPYGRRLIIGANIGKSKVTPAPEAVADYVHSARLLAPLVDYLVVNVSSPNTPGLRDLQQVQTLAPILTEVERAARGAAAREVPVLVKIAPDLADDDVDAVAELVRTLELAGVVAVNTTIDHEHAAGGMSGPPVRQRGLEVVRRLREGLHADQMIIGVGGISTPQDAREYLSAGADALQAYTGFIYGGPTWPAAMNAGLRPGTDRV